MESLLNPEYWLFMSEVLKWFLCGIVIAFIILGNTLPFTLGSIHKSKSGKWYATLIMWLTGLPIVKLVFFNVLFAVAFVAIMVGTVYSLALWLIGMNFTMRDDIKALFMTGVGADQAGNAAMNGNPDETTSGWLGKLVELKLDRAPYFNEFWFMELLNFIDFTTKFHFRESIENDEKSPNEL
ncbi:MAG: hypothetical protein R3203_10180 [Pseudoalteromonas tetraodonis]|nr:hypothetical protein [Pseudoalteromonas tetraodonis]